MMPNRFNNNAFYTEAPTSSKNNAYDALLLTAVQNALAKNFSITKQQLDQNYQEFKKNNTVPAALINGAKKSPPAQQAKQTDNNPTMPEVGVNNTPQTPVEQKPSNQQQQPAPEQKPTQSSLKEDWKEYVKSASGSGMYVSIIKNKNNTYTIEHSTEKRESIFMAPDGIGRNYCNILIAPNASIQSLRNDLISQYFDITGAGLNGTSIVSITPAAFDATNTKNVYTLNSKGIIETAQDQQPVQPQPQNQTQQPAAPQAQPQAQQPAQPQAQQAPQAQQQPQSSKTTWDQLKTMASKGQQFIFKPAPDEYGGPWYLYKSNEPGNFFGFPAQSNPGDYQVYPNPGWFRPDNEPFREHYDDMDAAFEGVVKNGMGGAVTNIAPAIFAPDNSTKGQQQGRYKLLEKGIVEQEPDTSQK